MPSRNILFYKMWYLERIVPGKASDTFVDFRSIVVTKRVLV